MSDLRLASKFEQNDAGLLATVEADSYETPGPDAAHLRGVRVSVYWHVPTDGSEPYVVVDLDSEEDRPPVRVYLNDGPIYSEEV